MFYQNNAESESLRQELQLKNLAQYNEKKSIKRIGNFASFAYIVMTVVSAIVCVGINLISYAVGYNIMGNSIFLWILQAILSFLGFVVIYGFAAKIAGYRPTATVKAGKFPPSKGIPLIMMCMGVAAIANILSSLFDSFMTAIGFSSRNTVDSYGRPDGILGFLLVVIVGAVLPSLIEEFAMRGLILGALKTKFSDGVAIVISAIFFGIMHANFSQIPFAFLLGLALGYTCVVTRSIWPCVIAHFLNNFLADISSYVLADATPIETALFNMIYILVLLIIGVIGMILILRDKSGYYKLHKHSDITPAPKLVRYFFTSVGGVLFIVLALMCAFGVSLTSLLSGLVF